MESAQPDKSKPFRDWLGSNKVFFETIAATLLSVMAVIVSLVQTKMVTRQTDLLALQTRLAEAQALPQFELVIDQRFNDLTSKFDDDYLIVTNRGGPVHETDIDTAYFLVITMDPNPRRFSKVELPVGGYFTVGFMSGTSTGQLGTDTSLCCRAARIFSSEQLDMLS